MNELNKFKLSLKPWQERFVYAPKKLKFLKSAWATGKTLALILAAIQESETYPDNLGVIFRKELTDLRDSTIKDFESYTGMKVNSSRDVQVGKSTIMFRHLEEMNNIQNMNLGWFGIEQGEELDTDDYFFKLMGRLRRANSSRRGYVIANANGHNWIYKLKQSGVIDPSTGDRLDAHYDACTFNNADVLTPDYLTSLEAIKERKPALYNRLVLNSDEDEDTVDRVILPEWIRKATERDLELRRPLRGIISIDVARYGDDKTVFYAIQGNKQMAKEVHEKKSTTEVVGRAILFARKQGNINSFAVDEIGVGAGVADQLQELDKEVVFVNSAKSSTFPGKYYNTRAEIYDYAAQLFQDGHVQVDKKDTDLIEQLSWAKYKTIKSNGLLQIEPKDDIKKRYGRSPDDADAFVNGLWALQKVARYLTGEQTQRTKYYVPERFREKVA